jgi:hypothetical protein
VNRLTFPHHSFWETLFEVAVWANVDRSTANFNISAFFLLLRYFTEAVLRLRRLMQGESWFVDSTRSFVCSSDVLESLCRPYLDFRCSLSPEVV